MDKSIMWPSIGYTEFTVKTTEYFIIILHSVLHIFCP